MANNDYATIAIGDIGTQLFYFNKDRVSSVVSSNASLTVAVDEAKFLKKVDYAASTVFTYSTSGTKWTTGTSSDAVDFTQYGITVTGTPSDSDTITIAYDDGKFEYAVPVTAGAEFGGDVESFDAPETDLDYVPKVGGRTTLNDVSYTSNYTAEKYRRISNITDDTTVNTYMEVFSDGSATIFKGTSGRPTITSGDDRQINWTIIPQFMKWIHDIYDLDTEDTNGLEDAWYDGTSLKIDLTSIPDYRPDYYTKENA